jgi:hypothetical protein
MVVAAALLLLAHGALSLSWTRSMAPCGVACFARTTTGAPRPTWAFASIVVRCGSWSRTASMRRVLES